MTVTMRICSTPAELERSLAIYNQVVPRRAVTSEDVRAWRGSSLATVEYLCASDDVEAGSAAASVHTSIPDVCRTFVSVLPGHRHRGIGSALFGAVSAWATGQRVRELETTVESEDKASLAFAQRRGFREHSREVGLELDLSRAEASDVEPPAGIEIALLADHPELAASAYHVGAEALPDVPGSEDWTPPPFEQFLATHLRGLAILLAVSGEEVVGYAKLHARPDGRTAEHGMTAVKRAWRGRGIAKSLKLAEIAWARANGLERLTATNEERNDAMQHINEVLGYRRTSGRVHLRADVRT